MAIFLRQTYEIKLPPPEQLVKEVYFSAKVKSVYLFYRAASGITFFLLQLIGLFQPKIKKFIQGRAEIGSYLKAHRDTSRKLIWMHTASLGEYEQGLPVLELLKENYPQYQLLVTFFSPSGYEVKAKAREDILFCYLPKDTVKSVHEFLNLADPSLAIIVKYEVWPVLFREVHVRKVPLVMISAIFDQKQAYFKWYGGVLRKALQTVDYFFVQDTVSKDLMSSLGLENSAISGDTRFDRVDEISQRDNTLDFMQNFCAGRKCLVAGSTWPEDEKHLIDFINNQKNKEWCYVLAPHQIKEEHIENLVASLSTETILYSDGIGTSASHAQVLIIDTVGLLTKIYSYAEMAYVGGGFATGLHNILEPAVFGIPVIIGPDYKKFKEAREMVDSCGVTSIKDKASMFEVVNRLFQNANLRQQQGQLNSDYIKKNKGASVQILEYLRKSL